MSLSLESYAAAILTNQDPKCQDISASAPQDEFSNIAAFYQRCVKTLRVGRLWWLDKKKKMSLRTA